MYWSESHEWACARTTTSEIVTILITCYLYKTTQKIDYEDSAQGGVSLSTYYHYFNIGGGYIFTVFVFVFYFSVEVRSTKLCTCSFSFFYIGFCSGN